MSSPASADRTFGEKETRMVTVFGGSGFLGRSLVATLAKAGWRVRVAVRSPGSANDLKVSGTPGQVQPVWCDITQPERVHNVLTGADAAINLVGILNESRKSRFSAVHIDGSENIATSVRAHGIGKFIHVSAIGAHRFSRSRYGRSKAAGEAVALKRASHAVIVRPSIVFGPDDAFFNRLARLFRLLVAFPVAGSGTKLQPVFVGDVANAIMMLLQSKTSAEKRVFELGGPEIMTHRALLELTLRYINRRRWLVPLPFPLILVKAWVLQQFPHPVLTVDQMQMLRRDNVVSSCALHSGATLEGLDIMPTPMNAILPDYLAQYRPGGIKPELTSHYSHRQREFC